MVLWKLENSTRKFLTSNRQALGQTNPTESARALENIIPALTEALQDSVPKVRANAADSLVRIGTPEAIESVLLFSNRHYGVMTQSHEPMLPIL